MHVVDHRPAHWFLFADGEALYLDANCNHSAFGYSVLIELDADERARFERRGADYLSSLATAIHDSAPAAAGSTSPYKDRDLTRTPIAERTREAFRAWRDDAEGPRR